uniref:Uncharacterized protein n=1 Tax=Meloidogyne javanica TaxID=6303 RepID=A0A915N7J6_MELJA
MGGGDFQPGSLLHALVVVARLHALVVARLHALPLPDQLLARFALHLLKSGRSTKRQLFALVSPKDGTKISKSLKPYFEGGQLNILFGSTNSQKIVKRVVEVYEVCDLSLVIVLGQ